MLLGTVLLLALVPQAPAEPGAAPAAAVAATEAVTSPHLEAGLEAFRKRRFARARDEFEKAVAAEPQSAAAAFYLGYAHYKLGEPSRRLTADKEKAKELFARAFSLDPAFKPVWGR